MKRLFNLLRHSKLVISQINNAFVLGLCFLVDDVEWSMEFLVWSIDIQWNWHCDLCKETHGYDSGYRSCL